MEVASKLKIYIAKQSMLDSIRESHPSLEDIYEFVVDSESRIGRVDDFRLIESLEPEKEPPKKKQHFPVQSRGKGKSNKQWQR